MTIPLIKRNDFSQGLVHLTRERIKYGSAAKKGKVGVSPFEVLKEILTTGIIRGSGKRGYIKGPHRAACFSEIPLSAVREFASDPTEEEARYRFYGVSLSKKAVFKAGGRPVIYLPENEGDWIPDDQKWRHVRFEHGKVDFTHEREWRVLGDLDLTKLPGLYVLVWSAIEAREINSMDTPVKKLIRGILPMEHLTTFL